jgi:NADH-quinone oxidoreductase subunit E
MLAEKYSDKIKFILSKYPAEQKQSAVMPLLYIAQRDGGYIKVDAMREIADILEMTPTEVASIVGFYTLFHDKPGGQYRIQVCTDLPCALRGADQFLTELCGRLGIEPGDTTPDGLVSVEPVKCLAACDKAPVFQVQTGDGLTYLENQNIDTAMKLIESWKKES